MKPHHFHPFDEERSRGFSLCHRTIQPCYGFDVNEILRVLQQINKGAVGPGCGPGRRESCRFRNRRGSYVLHQLSDGKRPGGVNDNKCPNIVLLEFTQHLLN